MTRLGKLGKDRCHPAMVQYNRLDSTTTTGSEEAVMPFRESESQKQLAESCRGHELPNQETPSSVVAFFVETKEGSGVLNDPNEIAQVIYRYGDDAQVCSLGFDYLRVAIEASPVALDPQWIALILQKIEQHGDQLDLIGRAIYLLWTLSSDYKEEIMEEGGIQLIMEILDVHLEDEIVQEGAPLLLGELVNGTPLLYERVIVAFVQKVVQQAAQGSTQTFDSATRALTHLAESVWDWEGNGEHPILPAFELVSIAVNIDQPMNIREAAMQLVSNQSIDHQQVAEQLLVYVADAWEYWNTSTLLNEALAIIGRSFSNETDSPENPSLWLSCAQVTLSSMRMYSGEEEIQETAVQTLSQILRDGRANGPLAAIMHSASGVQLVLAAMTNFPGNARIALVSWLVFSALQDVGDTSIPSTPMIRMFRNQVFHNQGLDQTTKTMVSKVFIKVCRQAVDSASINNSGMLIAIDKAIKVSNDSASLDNLFQLFLSFLSIAQTVGRGRTDRGIQLSKTYTAKTVQWLLGRLLQAAESKDVEVVEHSLQKLTELYYVVPFEGELGQTLRLDVGRAKVVVKTHTLGEVQAIRRVMICMRACGRVQEACFMAISSVFVHCWTKDVVETTHLTQVASEALVEVCYSLLAQQDNEEKVLLAGVYSYLILTHMCDNHLLTETSPVITQCIVQAFGNGQQRSIGMKHVACSYFKILLTKTFTGESPIDPMIRDCVLHLMCNISPAVALRGCQLVMILVKSSPEVKDALIRTDVFVAALIVAFETHPGNIDVLDHLAKLLETLFDFAALIHQERFANYGGMKAIVDCLGVLEDETKSRKLTTLIGPLTKVINVTDKAILFAHRLAISHSLIRALESVPTKKAVSVSIMQLMLSLRSQDAFFEGVWFAAVPALHQLMSLHFDDSLVHQYGTSLVLSAAIADSNVFISSDKCEQFIQFLVNVVLMAHSDSSQLVITILDILGVLAAAWSRMEEQTCQESVEVIVSVTTRNQHHCAIVVSALMTLLKTSDISESFLTILAGTDSLYDVLLAAMSQHPTDEQVQSNALLLLERCTKDIQGLKLMKLRLDDLVRVLFSTCKYRSGEWVGRATSLMAMLEESQI